jgi:NADH dehydrogenase
VDDGKRPRVVIIGGGFGGLYAAQALAHAPVDVTLIDRRNYHLFQPLLYQVATAALNPSDIAYPIRSILRKQRNVEVFLAEAERIDVARKVVTLAFGEVAYDYLIVATGATHSYFGHDAWEKPAPGLKSIEDALEIRRRMLYAFEAAERENDAERQRPWLNFVVVGGGPTGVELAGALAEVARQTLARDFRRIDPRHARIVLIEAGPRLLPAYAPELSESAKEQLERLGVEVRVGARVSGIDEDGVCIGSERILARTVLWGAGVQASPLGQSLGASLDRAGRVKVDAFLNPPGHPEVFVCGDLATLEQDGEPVPGIAPAAMQMGRHAAHTIERLVRGETPKPFRYWDKGMLATIGRSKAVGEIGRFKLAGFIAWCAWLFIHILYLIGFRNRVLVVIEWAWEYLTFKRGARLITGEYRHETPQSLPGDSALPPPPPVELGKTHEAQV